MLVFVFVSFLLVVVVGRGTHGSRWTRALGHCPGAIVLRCPLSVRSFVCTLATGRIGFLTARHHDFLGARKVRGCECHCMQHIGYHRQLCRLWRQALRMIVCAHRRNCWS